MVVTYRHDSPQEAIEAFRSGTTEWIVSVGMISEGTDIPRLQVCCHMSSVKTELYFRQVLGRILRVNNSAVQSTWLFTFAEESLTKYSERIKQDIPDCRVKIEPSKAQIHFNTIDSGSKNEHTAQGPKGGALVRAAEARAF